MNSDSPMDVNKARSRKFPALTMAECRLSANNDDEAFSANNLFSNSSLQTIRGAEILCIEQYTELRFCVIVINNNGRFWLFAVIVQDLEKSSNEKTRVTKARWTGKLKITILSKASSEV